jgi:hypothetical protein
MQCIFSKVVAKQSLHGFPQKVSRVFTPITFYGNGFDEAMQRPRIASGLNMPSAVSAK